MGRGAVLQTVRVVLELPDGNGYQLGTLGSRTRLLEAADESDRLRAALLDALAAGDSEASFAMSLKHQRGDAPPVLVNNGGEFTPPTFERTSEAPSVLCHRFDCDDGFEYLAAIAPRGEHPHVTVFGGRLGDREATGGWLLVESALQTVQHIVEGSRFPNKSPGPVCCYLYRRSKP